MLLPLQLSVVSLLVISRAKCSIGTIQGLTYMDPLVQRPKEEYLRGEDPCNPLYWYPRNIPDFCGQPSVPLPLPPIKPPAPPPTPTPFLPPLLPPLQPPLFPPFPPPMFPPPMFPPAMPPPFPAPFPPAFDPMPFPPMPMQLPVPVPFPRPMNQPCTYPYCPIYPPIPRRQIGMVPGVPGIVSPDGGINVLPFSDAYSDMLAKHDAKMMRSRLKKIMELNERYPTRSNYRFLKKLMRQYQ